jgi:pimeloyl-ACP methyl ester carboxylesterase
VSYGEVSAWDRMVWPEGRVESWLVSGEHRRELTAWFGESEYAFLQRLALAAAAVPQDPDRCVVYVPGLMGSQLCKPRERPQPDDLLWMDPSNISVGQLLRLSLPGEALAVAGPVQYGYLPLKFALQAAGYTVRCFAYDWRFSIADTAEGLSAMLGDESAREVSLVAHSMGGLLARRVLQGAQGARVQRLITLGTPHGGSFAPVQAVRGTYPLVRRLAQIDPHHDAEALAREVFSSFHSLYQMLPRDLTPDLLNERNWPATGPQPNATLLDRVKLLDLGGADPRITAIAGYGFQTVERIAHVEWDFYYRYGSGGDGTVPADRAVLAGCPAWHAKVFHGELPRAPVVHEALVALLAGSTPGLEPRLPALPDATTSLSDTRMRRAFAGKIDWTRLDSQQRRAFLDSLASAPPAMPTL